MQRFWYSSDKRRERFVSICQRPRRAAADLAGLHAQGTGAQASRWRTCASSSRTWPTCSGWSAPRSEETAGGCPVSLAVPCG
ncbi:MAG: hypothetical protein MZW92_69835 [Comamonadaceae bacterium]|nr:hypothetical protein [Comamonadaceae bacterium]